MAESSFPIKNEPMGDWQWGQVTSGLGSGVLGGAAGNYALVGFNNANNTAQLSAGGGESQAIVSGFYHRIDSNHTISLPAISSGTRTYHIGLLYDSGRHAEPLGPVSISVTTARPTGAGRVYLPLYEVVRRANQLLTDADVRVRRALISPVLSVAAVDELPDPTTMMQGTLCQTSNLDMLWRVSGSRWVPLNSTVIANPFSMGGWSLSIPAGGIELTYLSSGRRLAKISDAQATRTGSSFTQGTSYQPLGTLIPDSLRGSGTVSAPASLAMGAAAYSGVTRLDAGSGALSFRLGAGSQTLSPGHTILFSATWVI